MTGGSPASEREKGGKGRSGLGRELGRRKGTGPRERFFLGRGMKEKKKRWVGLKERGKRKPFHFSEMLQLFQIKFKLKDLNLS